MTDYSELVLALNRDESGWGHRKIKYVAAEAIEDLRAERDRLSREKSAASGSWDVAAALVRANDECDELQAERDRLSGIEDRLGEAAIGLQADRDHWKARAERLAAALEHATAAVWDAHYGKGIAVEYARKVDETARVAALDHQEGEQ